LVESESFFSLIFSGKPPMVTSVFLHICPPLRSFCDVTPRGSGSGERERRKPSPATLKWIHGDEAPRNPSKDVA